eukprot:4494479-Pyramimonas_sp.AAC.1
MSFVSTGDCDLEPSMPESRGWVSARDAVTVATEEGACRPADRALNHFVVSREIAVAARAPARYGAATVPHCPVFY